MVRTQVYIPQDTHKKLNRIAKEYAKPMAEIVREFIEQGITALQHKDRSGKKTLAAIAKLKYKGGDKNLSANIDHYLYGAAKHE